MCLSPISLGLTLSNSLFIFPFLITKTTSFYGLLYNPINPIFSICLSRLGFVLSHFRWQHQERTLRSKKWKTHTKNKIQRESRTRIKKPTQRSREKKSTNPVVVAIWSLRHLASIAAASLVWFFCLRGLGFVLCGFLFGFQGFWVCGLGFVLRVWVSRFLGVWVLFFVISGFQGRRLWVWLCRYASSPFSLFCFVFFFLV